MGDTAYGNKLLIHTAFNVLMTMTMLREIG